MTPEQIAAKERALAILARLEKTFAEIEAEKAAEAYRRKHEYDHLFYGISDV